MLEAHKLQIFWDRLIYSHQTVSRESVPSLKEAKDYNLFDFDEPLKFWTDLWPLADVIAELNEICFHWTGFLMICSYFKEMGEHSNF